MSISITIYFLFSPLLVICIVPIFTKKVFCMKLK